MQWEWERLRKVPLFTAPDPLNTSAHPCMWEDQLLSYRGGREGGAHGLTVRKKPIETKAKPRATLALPLAPSIGRLAIGHVDGRPSRTYGLSLSLSLSLSAFFYDAKSEVLTFEFVVIADTRTS